MSDVETYHRSLEKKCTTIQDQLRHLLADNEYLKKRLAKAQERLREVEREREFYKTERNRLIDNVLKPALRATNHLSPGGIIIGEGTIDVWLNELRIERDALRAQVEAMRWFHGLPTHPGWYWFRNRNIELDAQPYIVKVRDYAGALAIENSSLKGWKKFEQGEWAGPISQPADATAPQEGKAV